jgi:hypothetical protein
LREVAQALKFHGAAPRIAGSSRWLLAVRGAVAVPFRLWRLKGFVELAAEWILELLKPRNKKRRWQAQALQQVDGHSGLASTYFQSDQRM